MHLINIRPKLHHRKWRKLRVTLPVNMSTVPNFLNFTSILLILFFVQPLSGNYKLMSIVTFTFIHIFDHNFIFFIERRLSCRFCLYSVKIGVIFGVRFERRKVDKKCKPT